MKTILMIFCCMLLLVSCSTKALPETKEIPQDPSAQITEPIQDPVPTESKTTESEPIHTEPTVPEPDPKNDEYFNGSLFVGDSIMEGIRQYVVKERKADTVLGDAKFITTTIGITVADLTGYTEDTVYYSYRGEEMSVEDILSQIAPKRVFYLLGLNDLAAGTDNQLTVDRYLELIENTKKLLPDAEVIVIANPPKVASGWLPSYVKNREFNNELILDLVTRLKTMCDENGVEFVDIHTSLCNEDGALDDALCRDSYVHLNDSGAKIVVETLYKFAEYK